MTTIRAVFFDLDDTLCDAKPAFAAATASAFEAVRDRYPQLKAGEMAEQWRALHGPLFADLAAGRVSMAEVRTRRFRRLLASLGVLDDAFADEVDLLLGDTQLDLLTLFDDVTVLEALRSRKLHVGIITNGAGDARPDSQRSKAEHLGLLGRVDSFWVSDEMGFRKPDPRAFRPALDAIGIEPAEVLFVGDSHENDIIGASRAGMATVQLWRSKDPIPLALEHRPDYVIRSLNEIVDIVAGYNREPERRTTETFGSRDANVTYTDRRAAYAIILRGETVATVKSGNGKYFLPGGGSLPDETAQQTVLREIREEIGCNATITCWLEEAEQYFYSPSDECHYRMEAAFVMAELASEPVAATDDACEEELHWLPLAEVQEKLLHECHSWMAKRVYLGFRGEIVAN